MPRFDGTGPYGQGPMTGGGGGYCVRPLGSNLPGSRVRGFFGRGLGRGYGPGRGFGRGRGRGLARRWGYPVYGDPYRHEPAYSPQDEARALKEEARVMQDEIAAINQRIKDLESHSGSESSE